MTTPVFSRLLVASSDGSTDAARNHSAEAVHYLLRPAAGVNLSVSRIIVTIRDAGNLVDDKYGDNGGSLLTNGIIVAVRDASGIIQDLTDDPIKQNTDWGRYCYDYSVAAKNTSPVGQVRWTFSKSGRPIILEGDAGEFLAVTLEDNFSHLVEHRFCVQGTRLKGPVDFATDGLA